jgi:hypothetical protein
MDETINPGKEYANIIKLVNESDINKEDMYEKLMKKEEKVLDIISRVEEQSRNKKVESNLFYNTPILDIANNLITTWKVIIREATHEDQAAATPKAILWDGERKIYVGISIVLIALVFFFIDTSK